LIVVGLIAEGGDANEEHIHDIAND